jgi:hypothetical protein
MTTALAVRQLNPDSFKMIMEVAPYLHGARLFGTKSIEQAAAIMIKGHELGFSLTASFENIHVIEDKPSLSPKGCLALIYSSPECAGVSIKDEADSNGAPLACTVWMKRRNGAEYTTRFSMADAQRAGVIKAGSGWEKYPANMLRWRAVGYCADVVFPDVIGGTKRADEFGADLTPEGDVIEGSWSTVGSQTPPVNIFKPETAPAVTVSQSQPAMDPNRLQRLVEGYGAGAIMEANDGKIPGSNDDLDRVEKLLGIAK